MSRRQPLGGVVTLAVATLLIVATGDASAAAQAPKPNFVFVLTDDLANNLVPYMRNVQAMQRQGTSFDRYVVTDSLCCPSRASIFTGRYPHSTGVITNQPPTAASRSSTPSRRRARSRPACRRRATGRA